MLAVVCWSAGPASAAPAVTGAERVTFPSRDRGATPLLGWLFRPAGPGPFPAVVALHGCGGLYARRGDLGARHRDWAPAAPCRALGERVEAILRAALGGPSTPRR